MSPFARSASRLIPALLLLLCCAPALAQNSVRGPVQAPLPMQILEGEDQGAVSSPAAKSADKSAAPQGKFPNRDTAKNRQDYDLGTDSGADSIQVGRDEATGDTVLRHTPPSKAQPKNAFEDQPIQVRPTVRW